MRAFTATICLATIAAIVPPVSASDEVLSRAHLSKLGKVATVYVENGHSSVSVFCIHPSGLFVRMLFPRQGQYTAETKQIRKIDNTGGHAIWSVPALQGSYHLSFTQSSNGDMGVLRFTMGVHLAGDTRPLVTLLGLAESI